MASPGTMEEDSLEALLQEEAEAFGSQGQPPQPSSLEAMLEEEADAFGTQNNSEAGGLGYSIEGDLADLMDDDEPETPARPSGEAAAEQLSPPASAAGFSQGSSLAREIAGHPTEPASFSTQGSGADAGSPTQAPAKAEEFSTEQSLGKDDGLGKEEADLFGSDAEGEENKAAAGSGSCPATPQGQSEEKGGDDFVDEQRFMQDEHGNRLHKWKMDYAARGGGGRAMCHDMHCLERQEQAGVKTIEKGCLRIGRRILMDKGRSEGEAGTVTTLWYHAACIFNAFKRSRKGTRVIESRDDVEGFENISLEDQAWVRRLIDKSEELRPAMGARFGVNTATPQKRGPVGLDGIEIEPKRAKKLGEIENPKKGDRVWTFCRVRAEPPAGGAAPAVGGLLAVRSKKPELGTIREEGVDGSFIVQFESADHEKERIDMFGSNRMKKMRSWLKYPRQFEGKKQKIPKNWITKNRVPPRLCSCVKQDWNHQCEVGITCGRGYKNSVFGVDWK